MALPILAAGTLALAAILTAHSLVRLRYEDKPPVIEKIANQPPGTY